MAKTKAELEATAKEAGSQKANNASPEYSYNDLLAIINKLSDEITSLKQGKEPETKEGGLNDVLTLLASRKSDKEISIVHNRELTGGLTTHIELNNVIIDFRHIGETRLLSWQQFEECASKYRSFFDAKIILVDGAYAEVAEQYNLPCVTQSKNITQKDLINLPNLSASKLEEYVESLDEKDREIVFSYWLGKCYTKEKAFYDRHKMDVLNRLSNNMFDNILLVMNGEGRNIPNSK